MTPVCSKCKGEIKLRMKNRAYDYSECGILPESQSDYVLVTNPHDYSTIVICGTCVCNEKRKYVYDQIDSLF